MSVHPANARSYDSKGRWRTPTYTHADEAGGVNQKLYVVGDENTDGSIRVVGIANNPNPRMETRKSGVWELSTMRTASQGGQKIVSTSGNYTQEEDDDVIIVNGPGTIQLLELSKTFKQVKVRSNVQAAGQVKIQPFAGESVNNKASVNMRSGSSNAFVPQITLLDWAIVS